MKTSLSQGPAKILQTAATLAIPNDAFMKGTVETSSSHQQNLILQTQHNHPHGCLLFGKLPALFSS